MKVLDLGEILEHVDFTAMGKDAHEAVENAKTYLKENFPKDFAALEEHLKENFDKSLHFLVEEYEHAAKEIESELHPKKWWQFWK